MNIDARSWRRLGAALILIAVLAGAYLALSVSGALAYLREPEALREMLLSLGFWGPLSVVALMTLAIVLSPLPSAPIALAAGALFGYTLGTLFRAVHASATNAANGLPSVA